jgi:cytoskeletal protein CcmA (bactofilin family)
VAGVISNTQYEKPTMFGVNKVNSAKQAPFTFTAHVFTTDTVVISNEKHPRVLSVVTDLRSNKTNTINMVFVRNRILQPTFALDYYTNTLNVRANNTITQYGNYYYPYTTIAFYPEYPKVMKDMNSVGTALEGAGDEDEIFTMNEIEEEIEEEVVVEEEKKTGFWTHFKKQVAEEEVEVVSEPREKEEKVVMSYSAKQSGYGSEADAIISASMVITGNIELETGLVFAGKIIGNVSCKDTVESKAGGSIEGDLSALSAEFVGGSVKGNVTVGERVVVDEETVIEGDIKAKDIVISGKVVGEIKAENSVRLTSSAVIKGDLFAASISIETGAKVEGKFVVQS